LSGVFLRSLYSVHFCTLIQTENYSVKLMNLTTHRECDRSIGDAYSSYPADPTSGIYRDPFLPWFHFWYIQGSVFTLVPPLGDPGVCVYPDPTSGISRGLCLTWSHLWIQGSVFTLTPPLGDSGICVYPDPTSGISKGLCLPWSHLRVRQSLYFTFLVGAKTLIIVRYLNLFMRKVTIVLKHVLLRKLVLKII
jgi:hypothetical protein